MEPGAAELEEQPLEQQMELDAAELEGPQQPLEEDEQPLDEQQPEEQQEPDAAELEELQPEEQHKSEDERQLEVERQPAEPEPAEAAAVWTACHPDVDLTEGRTLATNSSPDVGYRSAVCGEAAHAMGGGGGGRRLYYAEFAVVKKTGDIAVGVVPADAAGRAPQEMKDWSEHPAAHMWNSRYGEHFQGGSNSDWPGMAGYRPGDTAGLLLDVEGGTLTAFKNGARLGVVVPNKVPSLGAGPFHWAVDFCGAGDSVRIDATKPPPEDALAGVAAAAAEESAEPAEATEAVEAHRVVEADPEGTGAAVEEPPAPEEVQAPVEARAAPAQEDAAPGSEPTLEPPPEPEIAPEEPALDLDPLRRPEPEPEPQSPVPEAAEAPRDEDAQVRRQLMCAEHSCAFTLAFGGDFDGLVGVQGSPERDVFKQRFARDVSHALSAAGSDPVGFGRFVFSSVAAGSVSPAVDVEIEPRKDFSGSAGVLCCAEGKQLVLPAGSTVRRAFYGDRRALWDENHGHVVTEQVSEAHGYGMMDTTVQADSSLLTPVQKDDSIREAEVDRAADSGSLVLAIEFEGADVPANAILDPATVKAAFSAVVYMPSLDVSTAGPATCVVKLPLRDACKEMEKHGLTTAEQEKLVEEGVIAVEQFLQLTDEDFSICGIDIVARRAARAAAIQAAASAKAAASSAATAAEAAACARQAQEDAGAADVAGLACLLRDEGAAMSAKGRRIVMDVSKTLSSLSAHGERQLDVMRVLGLGIFDRRVMADLLQSSPTVHRAALAAALPSLSDHGWRALEALEATTHATLHALSEEAKCSLLDHTLLRNDAAMVEHVLGLAAPPALAWCAADGVKISSDGVATATSHAGVTGRRLAVCGEVISADGDEVAYAEFTWLGGEFTTIGLVCEARTTSSGFSGSGSGSGSSDDATPAECTSSPVRSSPDGEGSSSKGGVWQTDCGWMFFCRGGGLWHAGDALPWIRGTMQPIQVGETIGLLLCKGQLSIFFKQQATVGVLCTGIPRGEYAWAADLYDVGDSVAIRRAQLPVELEVLLMSGSDTRTASQECGMQSRAALSITQDDIFTAVKDATTSLVVAGYRLSLQAQVQAPELSTDTATKGASLGAAC